MAMKTIYTCDVTGYSSEDAKEFCYITIECRPQLGAQLNGSHLEKYVHVEFAHKLGLCYNRFKPELKPLEVEPTFEEKLTALLREIARDVVLDELSDRGL